MLKRRSLAIKIETPGGDNPLLLELTDTDDLFAGVPVSDLAFVAKGGTPPYAFSIVGGSSSALPTGLTLSAPDPEITGTPTTPGHYTFVGQVEDSDSQIFLRTFTLSVDAPLFGVAISPTTGEIDVAYSYRFIVADDTGTHLTTGYSVIGGTVPAGLTVHANGIMDGTPTAPEGTSYFTLQATNGTYTVTFPIQVTIVAAVALTFTEDRDPPLGWGGGAGSWLPSIDRGIDYTAHMVVTGGIGPFSFSFSEVDPPPSGFVLLQERLLVKGKTLDAASVNPKLLAIQVTDAVGGTDLAQRAVFLIDAQQGRINPRVGGVDIPGGNGPLALNIEENVAGFDIEGDQSAGQINWKIPISRVRTVAGIGPDSSGNVDITINGAGPDSSGDFFVGGSVESVNGIGPDSSGNVTLPFPKRGPGCVFTNGGLALTGTLTGEIEVPYAFAGTGWTIVVDASGSGSIIVSHSTYAAYNTMTTLFTATLTSAIKNQATGLTFSLAAGDIIRFSGSGFATATRLSIQLNGRPS